MGYIETILRRHTALTAALEDGRAPERADDWTQPLPAGAAGNAAGGAEDESAGAETAAPAASDDAVSGPLEALEQELAELAAARQAIWAVRQRAARFETVRASGETGAGSAGYGGVRTLAAQPMRSAGLAGAQTQWSMAEISRFFERDARRYGG